MGSYRFVTDYTLDTVITNPEDLPRKISGNLAKTDQQTVVEYLEDSLLKYINKNSRRLYIKGETCKEYLKNVHKEYFFGLVSPDGCILGKRKSIRTMEYITIEHKSRRNGYSSLKQLLTYVFVSSIPLLLDNTDITQVQIIGLLVTGNYYSGYILNKCNLKECNYYYSIHHIKLSENKPIATSYIRGYGRISIDKIIRARYNIKQEEYIRKILNIINIYRKTRDVNTIRNLKDFNINSNILTGSKLLGYII